MLHVLPRKSGTLLLLPRIHSMLLFLSRIHSRTVNTDIDLLEATKDS